ncbi:glycoside hydrolase family 43 protein [uncultured Duncaniella sp.]|uniref:glycoside hydrolase family 43 protein n=1 Tax=uncultured Duncaniella sp. TaxID=2768039 RepID=UPI0025A9DF0C|nr:glycoside hydrolase family 43 protein [uncultured Duncaniella sp.]
MCSCNQQGAGNETGDDLYMFTSFHEPADEGLRFLYSEDGIHWDSIAGTWLAPTLGDSIMRDPSIVVGPDSTFHLVWTIAWKGDTGFGYSSSRDLVNWSEQRRIPAMDSVASTQNLWAPELFYDDVKGQYMVVYASCVPDVGFDVGIEEEKNNHRLYYVTTKDFTTFSDPKLFYEPGFSCIDATLVKRGPEDYVMVVKDNTRPNRNIKVAFAKDAEGPYTAASEPFTESFTEGPSVAKVGDEYYIYYDTYRKFIYSAHKTSDFKTFTDVTDSISVPSGHKHGTIFRAPRSVVEKLIEARKK